MQLTAVLLYASLGPSLALAIPTKFTTLQLPSADTSQDGGPSTPHTTVYGNLQLSFRHCGRPAPAFLQREVFFDFDILRHLMMSSSHPFTSNPVTLQSNIVTMIYIVDGYIWKIFHLSQHINDIYTMHMM